MCINKCLFSYFISHQLTKSCKHVLWWCCLKNIKIFLYAAGVYCISKQSHSLASTLKYIETRIIWHFRQCILAVVNKSCSGRCTAYVGWYCSCCTSPEKAEQSSGSCSETPPLGCGQRSGTLCGVPRSCHRNCGRNATINKLSQDVIVGWISTCTLHKACV